MWKDLPQANYLFLMEQTTRFRKTMLEFMFVLLILNCGILLKKAIMFPLSFLVTGKYQRSQMNMLKMTPRKGR